MKTGSSGAFVISWSQTETDGVKAAPLDMLTVGVSWRWTGAAVRVDGPSEVLRLDGAAGVAEVRRRAARVARRLVGPLARSLADLGEDQDPVPAPQTFRVTDGYSSYEMTVVAVPDTGALLVVAEGQLPLPDHDLWVVQVAIDRRHIAPRRDGGVICFTPDTTILTPRGPRAIQHLRQGDLVLTRDSGAQAVLWTGKRHISAARLHVMRHLRPIRFRKDAFGTGRPDPDLLVSPHHRMLIKGRAAQALFSVDEVLVKAEDLVNDLTVVTDCALREVTYVHILLERHSVIWANGLETESFHPASAAPDSIDPAQRMGLSAVLPSLEANPHAYGDFARRSLTTFEACVLRHDMPALGC